MSQEFVVIDPQGKEIGWVDPVIDLAETEDAYEVDNGYYTYRIEKKPGHTYITREMEPEA